MQATLWQYALAALFAGLTLATGAVTVYIAKRSSASKAAQVLGNFWQVATSTVAHADAELRPAITSALADGKLTAEEGKALKAQALALLKKQLGDEGLEAVRKSAMVATEGFAPWLSGALERVISAKKETTVLATPVAVTPSTVLGELVAPKVAPLVATSPK